MQQTVQTIEVSATPQQLFDVVADVGSYPGWATGVTEAEVLASDERGRPRRARMVIAAFHKRISYELDYTCEEPHRLEWTALPGPDLRAMDGYYEFVPLEEGGTRVIYALRADPAFPIPGFIRRQVEKTIVTTALRGLKRHTEAIAGRAET